MKACYQIPESMTYLNPKKMHKKNFFFVLFGLLTPAEEKKFGKIKRSKGRQRATRRAGRMLGPL